MAGMSIAPIVFSRGAAAGLALALTTVAVGAQSGAGAALASLQTRAERSGFTETSRYDDVQTFLATVDRASPLVHLTSFGYSFEGRGRCRWPSSAACADARPATVKASGKLRVYVQANIHAGEVEGKEAHAGASSATWPRPARRVARLDGAAGRPGLQRRRHRERHAHEPWLTSTGRSAARARAPTRRASTSTATT